MLEPGPNVSDPNGVPVPNIALSAFKKVDSVTLQPGGKVDAKLLVNGTEPVGEVTSDAVTKICKVLAPPEVLKFIELLSKMISPTPGDVPETVFPVHTPALNGEITVVIAPPVPTRDPIVMVAAAAADAQITEHATAQVARRTEGRIFCIPCSLDLDPHPTYEITIKPPRDQSNLRYESYNLRYASSSIT